MEKDIPTFLLLLIIAISRSYQGVASFLPALVLVCFISAVYVRERRLQAWRDFANQLKSHREELRSGGTVVVDNLLIRYNTILTKYQLSLGFLLSNIAVPSRVKVHSGEEHLEAYLYSLGSILFGWWALPTGPLHTLHCAQSALRGGEKISVAMLIDEKLFERFAEQEREAEELFLADLDSQSEKEEAEDTIDTPGVETEEETPNAGPTFARERFLRGRTPFPHQPLREKRFRTRTYPKISQLYQTVSSVLSKT